MNSSDTRIAPSDYVRLEMFLDMADHYIKSCDDLPLPEGSNTFKIGVEYEPLSTALELRLMLLRKFIEPSGHRNVSLERVAESFQKCYKGSSDTLERNLKSYVEDVRKLMRGEVGLKINEKPQKENFATLLTVLYGNLLHADWGKWSALKNCSDFTTRMVVYTVYIDLDRLVREAHLSISEAMKKGKLQDVAANTA